MPPRANATTTTTAPLLAGAAPSASVDWARVSTNMRIIDDPTLYTSRYASVSPPLLLPGQQTLPPRQLRLFEGVAPPRTRAMTTIEAEEGNGSGGGGNNSNKSRRTPAAPLPPWSDAGCAFFAGGPIWALDWCPPQEEEDGEAEEEDENSNNRLLAVSAHPPAAATTAIGQRLSGPALVQIWRVPRHCSVDSREGDKQRLGKRPKLAAATDATAARTGAAAAAAATATLLPPALAFALAHGGCLARDLKWRPESSNSSLSSSDSIGILAAALGDGSLTLWAVPSEAAVTKKRKSSSAAAAAAAAAVVVELVPLAVGSGCGLLSAVAWCPRKCRKGGAEDELATAGFDGSAVLWRVEAAGNDDGEPSASKTAARLVPLLRTPRDAGGPLRCVAFPPSPGVALLHASGNGAPVPALRAFATAGHSPDARVWDASDPGGGCLLARLPLASSRAWAFSMAWLSLPLGLLIAQDGGRLLFLPLDGGGGAASAAEGSVAPSGCKKCAPNKKKGSKSSSSGSNKSNGGSGEQQQHQLRLCCVAGGAESRDDAVWGVSACPGTATLAAYCTSGGFVATVDVLPTAGARDAALGLGIGNGAGGGGGVQSVVSGFVPASAMMTQASSSSSSSSSTDNSSVVVALPLTSEMRALAARAERAAEADAEAQQLAAAAADAAHAAAAAARGPAQLGRSSSTAAAAGRGGGRGGRGGSGRAPAAATTVQEPAPPRPVYALRDARLSVNCVRFSDLSVVRGRTWSALAAGGGLGVVRVHEVDVERVARGRV